MLLLVSHQASKPFFPEPVIPLGKPGILCDLNSLLGLSFPVCNMWVWEKLVQAALAPCPLLPPRPGLRSGVSVLSHGHSLSCLSSGHTWPCRRGGVCGLFGRELPRKFLGADFLPVFCAAPPFHPRAKAWAAPGEVPPSSSHSGLLPLRPELLGHKLPPERAWRLKGRRGKFLP